MVPFPCPFFPAGCGRKRDTETALGVYRPHRQRFPTGNRMTLVVLGFSVPPRLAAVWSISLLSLHLRFCGNLLLAYPPFSLPRLYGTLPSCCWCEPDVACGEEPPCCCDLIFLYRFWSDLQYTYSIWNIRVQQ